MNINVESQQFGSVSTLRQSFLTLADRGTTISWQAFKAQHGHLANPQTSEQQQSQTLTAAEFRDPRLFAQTITNQLRNFWHSPAIQTTTLQEASINDIGIMSLNWFVEITGTDIPEFANRHYELAQGKQLSMAPLNTYMEQRRIHVIEGLRCANEPRNWGISSGERNIMGSICRDYYQECINRHKRQHGSKKGSLRAFPNNLERLYVGELLANFLRDNPPLTVADRATRNQFTRFGVPDDILPTGWTQQTLSEYAASHKLNTAVLPQFIFSSDAGRPTTTLHPK